MAYYFGQVKGRTGSGASRLGSESSGIESSVQSWDGSITVSLHHGSHFTIYTRPDSGVRGREILSGELADLIAAGDSGARSVPAARVAFCLEQLQEALSAAAAARAVADLKARAPESRGVIASTLDEDDEPHAGPCNHSPEIAKTCPKAGRTRAEARAEARAAGVLDGLESAL